MSEMRELESLFVRVPKKECCWTEEKKEAKCCHPILAASQDRRPVFGTNYHRNGCTGSVDRRAEGGRTDGHKKNIKNRLRR